MSIDFSLSQIQKTVVFDTNMTHNVSVFWRTAGCYDAIYNSDGMKASEVVPFLKRGYDTMVASPDTYRSMNPKNGWGNYDICIEWLGEIITACDQYPNSIISISK